MHRTAGFSIIAAGILSLVFYGCAEKGPILLDVSYQPPAAVAAATPKVVVGVGPFKDVRGMTASVLGKRTVPSGLENDLVVQGTVSELVLARVKEAFKARGVSVKDSSWDLTEPGIAADGAEVLIGGEINLLKVDSESKPFKTAVKSAVRMKLVIADSGEKKIIRTLDVNSKLEREDVLFSLANVQDTLSQALSSAIDQMFGDEVLKSRLK